MSARIAPPEPRSAAQEDRARADFYALIFAPVLAGRTPTARCHRGCDEIAGEAENNSLALPEVAEQRRVGDGRGGGAEEYDSVFVGTGKAEITLYQHNYLSENMKENVLVRCAPSLPKSVSRGTGGRSTRITSPHCAR